MEFKKIELNDKIIFDKYYKKYPQYLFAQHKGYGTKAHYAALTEHGPAPVHRMTFLKKFYGEA